MVSKMIEDLDRRGALGGFNHNKKIFFQGFRYGIMNEIGGERGGRRREFEEGEVEIGVTLRRA